MYLCNLSQSRAIGYIKYRLKIQKRLQHTCTCNITEFYLKMGCFGKSKLVTYLYWRPRVQIKYETKMIASNRILAPIVDNTAMPTVVCAQDWEESDDVVPVAGCTDVTGNVAKVAVVSTEDGVPSDDSRRTLSMLSWDISDLEPSIPAMSSAVLSFTT